jgi:hypothetical protein
VARDNAWVEVKWRAGMAEWGTRIPPYRLALVDPAPPHTNGRMSAQAFNRYAQSGAHLDSLND